MNDDDIVGEIKYQKGDGGGWKVTIGPNGANISMNEDTAFDWAKNVGAMRSGVLCDDCRHLDENDSCSFHGECPSRNAKDEGCADHVAVSESDDKFVVVVVDELLLSDGKFERGVTYIAEEIGPVDKDMIYVYDKFGEKRAYFRDRFKVGDEKEGGDR